MEENGGGGEKMRKQGHFELFYEDKYVQLNNE